MSAQPAASGFLDLNLAGLGANFNLGPSTADTAATAYSFMNNAFAMDTAFLGSSIAGSQQFLSAQTSPVLNNITKQGKIINAALPSIFSSISSTSSTTQSLINSITGAGMAAGQQVANASIQSSSNSSSGGSLCFITTAVCSSRGLPDDCEELQVLRAFRDSVMTAPQYQPLVKKYYVIAPRIVKAIDALPFAGELYNYLYDKYIQVALYLIAHGHNHAAVIVYSDMVLFASKFAE